MPYKDQLHCYRVINGQKYICWCDNPTDEQIADAKTKKIPHRVLKHKDGFKSLYVKETEALRLEA